MMKRQSIPTVLMSVLLFCLAQAKQIEVCAPVSVGELLDKITILTIKAERIPNELKQRNIKTELVELLETYEQNITPSQELKALTRELLEVNKALWDIEDAIREKEYKKEFDEEFIALARSVYIKNDKRCAIKRKINELLGSHLIEEKSYQNYQ